MSISRKIGKTIDVLREDENVRKVNDFEKYVINFFDDNYFSVAQWTTDIARKHDRFVESDCYPDLVIRYTYKAVSYTHLYILVIGLIKGFVTFG